MTISCPNCGAINAPGARFCSRCSTALTKNCSHCGQNQSAAARFCSACGQALHAFPTPAPLPTGRLQANTLLAGRYQIVSMLGRGGMGAVYLATDQRLAGKQVAIKEMSDQALISPAARQAAWRAFQQETQMLANLKHSNLPEVTDCFSEGGNQYLVMEFIQGETLEKKLELAGGPLPEPTVRRYAVQLCDVLGYLHSQQPPIIFRDLKPANIMVLPDGKQVKLIDFGIARHFNPGKSKDTQAMGTPGYAAPEQYGHEQSDARADIYALGATLHHMLTGRDPSVTPFQFPTVRSLNPIVSASIDHIVARAVETNLAQRWQSVQEMRNALFGQLSDASSPPLLSAIPQPAPVVLATHTGIQGFPLPSPVVQPVSIATPGFAPANMPAGLVGHIYASYGRRVAAFLLDLFLCITFINLMLVIGAGIGMLTSTDGVLLLLLLSCVAGLLYFVWPTAQYGRTLGKKALRIQVVDASGNPPGWTRAIARYVVGFGVEYLFLLFFFAGAISLLWPLWDANKQAGHDKLGGTYVIE